MATFQATQTKKMVSYASNESDYIHKKERLLMDHYKWNFSQLHKNLVEDRFSMLGLAK